MLRVWNPFSALYYKTPFKLAETAGCCKDFFLLILEKAATYCDILCLLSNCRCKIVLFVRRTPVWGKHRGGKNIVLHMLVSLNCFSLFGGDREGHSIQRETTKQQWLLTSPTQMTFDLVPPYFIPIVMSNHMQYNAYQLKVMILLMSKYSFWWLRVSSSVGVSHTKV